MGQVSNIVSSLLVVEVKDATQEPVVIYIEKKKTT